MNIRIVACALAGAALIASACAGRDTLAARAASVKRGDLKADVVRALNSPDTSDFEEDDEVLQYCRSGAQSTGTDSAEFTLVWLYKGAVTGVTGYRRAETGAPCRSKFKPVHWEDAPVRPTSR